MWGDNMIQRVERHERQRSVRGAQHDERAQGGGRDG